MSSQPDPYSHMSFEEQGKADEKIRQFEGFINGRADEINNSLEEEYDVEEIKGKEEGGRDKQQGGRCVAPDRGHR